MAEAKTPIKRRVGRPTNEELRNKGGRPTKMDGETLKKLEEAFAYGASDREACFYAGITEPVLYAYQNNNPEFVNHKMLLKERPILIARQSVVNGLTNSPELALKFLERKRRSEFATRQDVTSGDEPIQFTVVRNITPPEITEGEIVEQKALEAE